MTNYRLHARSTSAAILNIRCLLRFEFEKGRSQYASFQPHPGDTTTSLKFTINFNQNGQDPTPVHPYTLWVFVQYSRKEGEMYRCTGVPSVQKVLKLKMKMRQYDADEAGAMVMMLCF